MPRTFPKSHLSQLCLKYLQIKSIFFLDLKDRQHNYNNYITIFPPSWEEARMWVSIVMSENEEKEERNPKLKVFNLSCKRNVYS